MKRNILVCCEESQRVCIEFRKHGHNAFSCDLQACSGGHPEWHIKGDVLGLINGNCSFTTQNGDEYRIIGKWDMLIAHPPCTYLAKSGNKWFSVERYGERAIKRMRDREIAKEFFMRFVNADCDRIAIENPVGTMSSCYRKPDQIIQPFEFGEDAKKATCLWLKGLEPLKATNVISPTMITYENGKQIPKWSYETAKVLKSERAKIRSRTFEGIAKAMAIQWSNV